MVANDRGLLWWGPVAVVCALTALASNAATFPNGMCWQGANINLKFNPELAAELENPTRANPPFPSMGIDADRLATMQKAVDAWNAALAMVGAAQRITLAAPRPVVPWATEQGAGMCTDPDFNNEMVYRPSYAGTHPDQTNAGSTAENNRSAARQLGPGWIVGGAVESYAIDSRLAETALSPMPNNPGALFIQEADIVWFTHVSHGNQCPQLRWNYTGNMAAAPYYDYYSVMLHEIGHFLGLDHDNCAVVDKKTGLAINNVMQPMIRAGERNGIMKCELASLQKLYGAGGRCHIAPGMPGFPGPGMMPMPGPRLPRANGPR